MIPLHGHELGAIPRLGLRLMITRWRVFFQHLAQRCQFGAWPTHAWTMAYAPYDDPEIIILDEPFNGLDPSTQIRLINMLKNLDTNKDTTILVSSHDLSHVTEVCSRIAILENGVIVKDLKTSSSTLKELQSYFSVQ